MVDDLIALGFSRVEAEVFQAVVTKGPCFVAPIVHATKKHRQIIYNALESLEKQKLITVTKKNGKNFYQIAEPDRVVVTAKQSLVVAQQVAVRIRRSLSKDREVVEVFAGPHSYEQGLVDFRQHAEEAKEYIVIGGQPKEWYEFTRPIFDTHVQELRRLKRKGIDIFILFYESERASAEKYIKPYLRNPYVCKIAKDEYRIPQTCWLAGEHVYLLTPTSEPLVVSIKSKALSEQYREYFWKQWRGGQIL
jgi:sugar-specific transcriptional regulator TrmB